MQVATLVVRPTNSPDVWNTRVNKAWDAFFLCCICNWKLWNEGHLRFCLSVCLSVCLFLATVYFRFWNLFESFQKYCPELVIFISWSVGCISLPALAWTKKPWLLPSGFGSCPSVGYLMTHDTVFFWNSLLVTKPMRTVTWNTVVN